MKKSQRSLLDASLNKALDSAKSRPKRNLDDILSEYDDGKGIPTGIPSALPTTIPASIPAQQERKEAKPEPFTYLDATHTASEKAVYSVMHRETVNKGLTERNFGPAELMKKTGIGSRNTVHKALYGLLEKLSVEIVAEAAGNPLGPRYRVYRPQEIDERRKLAGMKVDPQSKKIVERGIPAGIPTTIPDAITRNRDSGILETGIPGIPNSGTLLNKEELLNSQRADDDEAFAKLRAAAKDVIGKDVPLSAFGELDDILAAELRLAAGRTTVSSVPAFLAEHLRRRLWKKDKRQIDEEGKAETPQSAIRVDASKCPDCFGTGMYYPEGFEKGVARCPHSKLTAEQ